MISSFKEKTGKSYPAPVIQVVKQHIGHIVDTMLRSFGPRNVVSVILTGSWGRCSGRFMQMNGKIVILSDYDTVVVVKSRSLLKTTFLKRDVEQRITEKLSRAGFKSSVSIQVTTEKRLISWGPSFFSYDLKLNGITCYGRNLIDSMSNTHGRVPVEDIVLLLLNRLTEVIAGLTLKPKHATTEEDLQHSLMLVKKGYFSILQSILGMNNIQVFDDQALMETNEKQLGCFQKLYANTISRYQNLTLEKVRNIQDFIKEWNIFLQCWHAAAHAILSNCNGDPKQEQNLNDLLLEYNCRCSENISKRIMKILLRLLECRGSSLNNFNDLLFLLIKGDLLLYIPIADFAFLKSSRFLVDKYILKKQCSPEKNLVKKNIATWVVAKGGHSPEPMNSKAICN